MMRLPLPFRRDFRALVAVLIVLIPAVTCNVMVFSISDVFVELQSWGKVIIGRFNGNDWPHNDIEHSRVVLDVKTVQLIGADSQVIKHYSLQGRNSRDFNIDRWEDSQCSGVSAHARRMTNSDLGDLGGYLQIKVCIFTEPGEVSSGGIVTMVNVGHVRYEVSLHDMTACDGCDAIKFVEVTLGVASGSQHAPVAHMGAPPEDAIDVEVLGAAFITVESGVFIDNRATTLTYGFPEVEVQNEDVDVIVRAPIFSSQISYGLILEPDRRDPNAVFTTTIAHITSADPLDVSAIPPGQNFPESDQENKVVYHDVDGSDSKQNSNISVAKHQANGDSNSSSSYMHFVSFQFYLLFGVVCIAVVLLL